MYLIDIDTYCRQILPPKKREEWRVIMLKVLLKPFFVIIESLVAYRKAKLSEINLNSQTIVLEQHLKNVFETSNLFLGKDDEGGVVYVPASWDQKKRNAVKSIIDKYIFLGHKYKVV